MNIEIIHQDNENVTLRAGKTEAHVAFFCGEINVTCRNRSHRVQRGPGRFFSTWDSAIDGYKSDAMKLAITTARDLLTGSAEGEQPDADMTPDEARDVLADRRPGDTATALWVLGQSVAAEKAGRPRLPLVAEKAPVTPESDALGGRLYGPDGIDEAGWEKAMHQAESNEWRCYGCVSHLCFVQGRCMSKHGRRHSTSNDREQSNTRRDDDETAWLDGHRRVIVTGRRWVAGRVAVDVKRHPEEQDWPWIGEQFTTAEKHVHKTPACDRGPSALEAAFDDPAAAEQLKARLREIDEDHARPLAEADRIAAGRPASSSVIQCQESGAVLPASDASKPDRVDVRPVQGEQAGRPGLDEPEGVKAEPLAPEDKTPASGAAPRRRQQLTEEAVAVAFIKGGIKAGYSTVHELVESALNHPDMAIHPAIHAALQNIGALEPHGIYWDGKNQRLSLNSKNRVE